MAKFGAGVTDAQAKQARQFEQAGLTTYSQAIKAFQRHDQQQIEAWKQALHEKQQKEQKA